MKITFYENNKVDQEYTVSIEDLVNDYKAKEDKYYGMPFERGFLIHLMDYGSFDVISDDEWKEIHSERVRQKNKYFALR